MLEELGCGSLQDLINDGPSEEQCRRIGSSEKEHIDGDHLAQPLDNFDPQRWGVKPGMTQQDDLTSDPLCALLMHRSAPACAVLLLALPLHHPLYTLHVRRTIPDLWDCPTARLPVCFGRGIDPTENERTTKENKHVI